VRGTHAVPIAAAQDHKRIGEGDTGPNTGGMAPTHDELLPPDLSTWLTIKRPEVVDGMRSEGDPFVGILSAAS